MVEPIVPLLARFLRCASDDLPAIAALDSALHNGLVTRDQIEQALRSRHDADRGRRRLAMASARARSPLETAARLEMVEAGLPVRDGVVLTGVGEVDFLVANRLVVETDGRGFHEDAWQFQVDRQRDRAAAALGLTTLRFTFDDVVRGDVVPDVMRALAAPRR